MKYIILDYAVLWLSTDHGMYGLSQSTCCQFTFCLVVQCSNSTPVIKIKSKLYLVNTRFILHIMIVYLFLFHFDIVCGDFGLP